MTRTAEAGERADQAAAPAIAVQLSMHVRQALASRESCASRGIFSHISAVVPQMRAHIAHMSARSGDMRHIISAQVRVMAAQSIIRRMSAASIIAPGMSIQYEMVSSHNTEQDMHSSMALRVDSRIFSVCCMGHLRCAGGGVGAAPEPACGGCSGIPDDSFGQRICIPTV
ncbi:hypothetical protein FAIPA1_60139 [Frankia sp. AiPs1]